MSEAELIEAVSGCAREALARGLSVPLEGVGNLIPSLRSDGLTVTLCRVESGQRFGRWTAIRLLPTDQGLWWDCRCRYCREIQSIRESRLLGGRLPKCPTCKGRLTRSRIARTHQMWLRLRVRDFCDRNNGKKSGREWYCRCTGCGFERWIHERKFQSGETIYCSRCAARKKGGSDGDAGRCDLATGG